MCDRPHSVSPSTTVTSFLSEGHEGNHASEYPRDSGSVSSIDQPEASDSGALSERYATRPTGDPQVKSVMLTGTGHFCLVRAGQIFAS